MEFLGLLTGISRVARGRGPRRGRRGDSPVFFRSPGTGTGTGSPGAGKKYRGRGPRVPVSPDLLIFHAKSLDL